MEPHFRSEARRNFRRELFNMKEKGYLKPEIVEHVANAHAQYHQDLLAEDRKREEMRAAPSQRPAQIPQRPAAQPGVPQRPAAQPAVTQQPAVQASAPIRREPVPKKPVKKLTKEQIRERNISWLLNIGVIFLLIGGLFVATSNWETMSNVMKSSSIALVSLLFYGFAYLSAKVLKIEKTAFAFTVLGSLFLPIYVLSLGWFGLLGPYLSVNGEGGYLLGFLGSSIPALAYVFLAKKLKSRLFVWFTFIAASAAAGFLLASFRMRVDYFYLGIMAYNSLLIFLYFKVKNREAFRLFTKEFPIFIQANLVVSTLLMLFFFDNELIYSFNLLLTAAIYLSMMYVSGKREYHFIFSAMLVYGAYQLIEHSFLEAGDAVLYALLAFGFAFIPKALKGNMLLDKAFRYTSAAVSILAFLYISVEGVFLRAGEPSVVLVIAYLIMAGNFLYLAHAEKAWLLAYISTFFLATAIHEAISLISKYYYLVSREAAIYAAGLILFILFGFLISKKAFALLRNPSRDVGLAAMLLAILLSQGMGNLAEPGIMLAIFSVAALAQVFTEKRSILQKSAVWAVPVSAGLSIIAFGMQAGKSWPTIANDYGHPVNFAAAGLFVLIISFIWKKQGREELSGSFFYTGQLLYTVGLLLSTSTDIDPIIVRPFLVLVALVIYYILYKVHRMSVTAFWLSAVSLGFYYSIVSSVYNLVSFGDMVKSIVIPGGGIFLLLLALIVLNRDNLLFKSFGWSGHLVLPITLFLTWTIYPEWCLFSLAAAIAVYSLSSFMAESGWRKISFMYAAFTAGFLTASKAFELGLGDSRAVYEFPATSFLLFLVWYLLKGNLKKWASFYLTAISLLGVVAMTFGDPFTSFAFCVTILYAAGTLGLLHKMKWDLLGVIPVLMGYFSTMAFLSVSSFFTNVTAYLILGAAGMIHVLIGKALYREMLVFNSEVEKSKIDWYTIASVLYFGSMFSYHLENILLAALPGLLISISIWLQRRRVGNKAGFFVPFFAGAFLLQPYYAVIGRLEIPALFEREVYFLPLIALIIFLRWSMKGRYRNITSKLQWAVLIFTALVLIQDGLQSNTVYDALILGTLSLAAMLAGMFLRIKSYFFTGKGVLLLNVLLQTRPFWGNLPWWGYLLAVGSLLIGIASYNEWKKTKQPDGREPFATRLKQKIRAYMKDWN
ncbi:hypothetical protein [Bacillus sp. B-jedd]|uniref:hypothetical protein n=1 Tax=Bacillus sp. B-jedd TaxID=1476857 RepID=UPI0005155DBC|nr:hypothetical protein [Bacillus sp. B-jedd]CEG27326.1 hypothetical protein BN1002_02185 [Bacillus sp. B-jedd]